MLLPAALGLGSGATLGLGPATGHASGLAIPDSAFVQRQGTDFVQNGLRFRPAGANCFYLMTFAADPGLRAAVDEVLEETALMGLTVVRTWGFNDGSGWNALQTAPGVYDEAVFQGLDYVLDRCSRLGLRVVLPLVNNWTDYGGMDQYVAWSPTASFHDDFYTDPACRSWYADHAAAMAGRVNTVNGRTYRDDPTILAWELANEPRCASDPSGNTLQAWIEEMSAVLKAADPNHLLGTGSEGFYDDDGATAWYLDGSQGVDYLRNHAAPGVDYAGSHSWPDTWGISAAAAVGLLSRQASDAAGMLGKPFLLGEFGKHRDAAEGPSRVFAARAHYDPATYFSPGAAPGPVPGASPLRDPGERYPRPPSGEPGFERTLPPSGLPFSPEPLSAEGRDPFFSECFQVVSGDDGDGGMYWAAYHDAYPDYDGFGVYYPSDSSTVSLIEAFADVMASPRTGTTPPLILGRPYPNPFVQSLTLPFTIPSGLGGLPAPLPVRAAVHDLQGRLVRILFDGERGPGDHVISWGGRDASGVNLPTGIYFLSVQTQTGRWSRKVVRIQE
jgi:mannan endo-1,4-beta-mannosidase